MASQPSHAAGPHDPRSHGEEPVVVRPLAKIVFLYPTMLAALIAACGMHFDRPHEGIYGGLFMIVFAIDLLAVGFDITHTVALGAGLAIAALVFGGLYANEHYNVIGALREVTRHIHLVAHPQFYAFIAAIIFFCELVALAIARLDYWVITPNEVVHRHGIPRNVERMPSPQLRVNKEITDVLEYLLLASGTLILHGQDMHRSIVLDNIPRVNHKEMRIRRLLGALEVVEVSEGSAT